MKLNLRAANLIDRPRSPAGAIMRLAPNAETSATSQSRTVRFILSTGEVDRYGDRIDPAGWRLANYRKNPVVLFAHDRSALPIGRCSFVGLVHGRLVGDIEFMSGEMTRSPTRFSRWCAGDFSTPAASASLRWNSHDRPTRSAPAASISHRSSCSKSASCRFPLSRPPSSPRAPPVSRRALSTTWRRVNSQERKTP